MAGLLQDVRFAFRQLRKSLGFTIAATAMLAVAICANSTVFSWINGTMLHPIPGARDTGALVSVLRGEWSTSPAPSFSYLDYRDVREQNHSFVGMLAYHHDWITLTHGRAMPERIYICNVSSNFFGVLGVKPLLGRFFLPEEETRPDAVPDVVLGYSLWKTRFGGDRAIVGKSIEIARHPVTVIGVAPQGFIGAMPGIREDAWLTLNPLGTSAYKMMNRSIYHYDVLARLRPGVNREQATSDVQTIMQRIVAAYPNNHLGNNTITLDPMWRSPFGANGYIAASLPVLLAIAGVVMLLTCVNVATLTLVRFVSRRREIAIRQSLGAPRVHLMRQMMIEGTVVSLAGGCLALLLTVWTAKRFADFFAPNANPLAINGLLDYKVTIGIMAVALLASLACGALPAWRSSQLPAVEILKEDSGSVAGGSHNRRLLSALVVAQIALSLALLSISALLLRTLRNVTGANPGFEQDHILTASVGLNISGYSKEQEETIRHKILDRMSVVPGVTMAALTDFVPMSFTRKSAPIYPQGYAPRPHESLDVRRAEVSARYFEQMGIPIIEGREFTQDDNEKAPLVVIVDEMAAGQYWPGQNPLGKQLMVNGQPFTVVGVAKNTTHQFMNEPIERMIYLSFFQQAHDETIVQVKTKGNPADLAQSVEEAIHEIDPQIPVFDVRTMRETTQIASIFTVMESTFAGLFAVIALLLATTGIYGVVAYRTALRMREISIRVALGASLGDVLRLVLLQGLRLTLAGLGLGLALTFSFTRFIATQLYGVGVNDPPTLIAVAVLLAAMSLLACYMPARRATRVDPVAAIR